MTNLALMNAVDHLLLVVRVGQGKQGSTKAPQSPAKPSGRVKGKC